MYHELFIYEGSSQEKNQSRYACSHSIKYERIKKKRKKKVEVMIVELKRRRNKQMACTVYTIKYMNLKTNKNDIIIKK